MPTVTKKKRQLKPHEKPSVIKQYLAEKRGGNKPPKKQSPKRS